MLDDTELIDVLAVTKQTAGEVNERLTGASETNKKINEACEEYRPVAHRATLIYFLIAEFSVVNCMYQTSLNQFNQLYELAIDNSEKATLPSKRINNIIDYMTYEIYLYIQRGLFERHKIIFALMLTSKVLASAGKVKAEEIDIFLKGGGALDINSVRKKPKVLRLTILCRYQRMLCSCVFAALWHMLLHRIMCMFNGRVKAVCMMDYVICKPVLPCATAVMS